MRTSTLPYAFMACRLLKQIKDFAFEVYLHPYFIVYMFGVVKLKVKVKVKSVCASLSIS
jgi:hypothetical protein